MNGENEEKRRVTEWAKDKLGPVVLEELENAEKRRVMLLRVDRLRRGNYQFGCYGEHHGCGTVDCPRGLHHHHNEFCEQPSLEELIAAGITVSLEKFVPMHRRSENRDQVE